MRQIKSHVAASLMAAALGLLPIAVSLTSAPADAMHCEFLEQGCANNGNPGGGGSGGGSGGGGTGTGGGGGSDPTYHFTCPAGYQVYCVDYQNGTGLHCTCRKIVTPDGGTP